MSVPRQSSSPSCRVSADETLGIGSGGGLTLVRSCPAIGAARTGWLSGDDRSAGWLERRAGGALSP